MRRTTEPPADERIARRELRSAVVMLVAAAVVLFLAWRGVWSFVWYFPHIFAIVVALLSVVSLLKARESLKVPRLAVTAAILVVCALLPRTHVRGVAAKTAGFERQGQQALVGERVPSIPYLAALHTGDGNAGVFDLGGRVALINFWATWCAPCVAELPLLEQLWQEGREHGILVVGVTRPSSGSASAEAIAEIERFVADRNVTYPIVIGDPDSRTDAAFHVKSIPTSVLVDATGEVVDVGVGITSTGRLIAAAKTLVVQPSE